MFSLLNVLMDVIIAWQDWEPTGKIQTLLYAVWSVIMVIIIVLWRVVAKCCKISSKIATDVFHCITPWTSRNKNLRELARSTHEYKQLVLQASNNAVSIIPHQAQDHDIGKRNKNTLFYLIPFEIRRHILMFAFGEQTIHMDLQFRYPFRLADMLHAPERLHARIEGQQLGVTKGEKHEWRWFSCVCHRFSPDAPELPLGRRRNYPWVRSNEPHTDRCLKGLGVCQKWPGDWPVKCQIGIMGWLLSCKQAYLEGIDVLYKTNTIHVASVILLRSIHLLIPRQRLADIASLELFFDSKMLPLSLAFIGIHGSPGKRPKWPVFPCLRILRLSFKKPVYGDDFTLGITWPYYDKNILTDRMNKFLPTVDEFLEKAVPYTTDVTVTCANWDSYAAIDLFLMANQGKKETRMQRADIEGLKCWRITPRKPWTVPGRAGRALEEARIAKGVRKGLWIHVCAKDVNLNDGYEYDQRRHNLYNLGPEPYLHV